VIEKEFEGDTEKALVAMVCCYKNTTQYFAKQLRNAMSGVGTNDRALVRTIVSRSEYDLGLIKDEFCRKYEKSLVKAIEVSISASF
jgi:Annexin